MLAIPREIVCLQCGDVFLTARPDPIPNLCSRECLLLYYEDVKLEEWLRACPILGGPANKLNCDGCVDREKCKRGEL